MKKQECPYCNQVKETVEWQETGEWVCQDCREDILKQEFEEAGDK